MKNIHRTLLALAALATLASAPALASQKIATQAGCVACHSVDKKLIGPSWHDIAVKYRGKADAAALMAARVRQGSTGVWGPLPMAPIDASKISDADLKTVVSWLLKTP